MAIKEGKNCKVSLGTNKVLGIGTWNMGGVATDQLDASQFGDQWKQFLLGQKDGGTITFAGLYDSADVTGQDALRDANANDTQITDIRFYVDATSYWTPSTTNPTSFVKVTSFEISAAQNGLVQVSFSCKVSGKMNRI